MVLQRNSGNDPVIRTILVAAVVAAIAAYAVSVLQPAPLTGKIVFADAKHTAGEVIAVNCPFRRPPMSAATCYRAYVPQDWRANDGKLISILAVMIAPPGGATRDDPFLYLEGGPGYAGVPTDYGNYGASGFLREHYAEVLATGRAMIFVDTRGLGQAEPSLHCPDALDTAWQDLKIRPAARNPGKVLAADTACFGALKEAGVDPGAYNSDFAARDLQALRRGLGIAQWNLYGISYGAQTALNLLAVDGKGVRSVIFDSPSYTRTAAFPADQAAFERVLDQVETGCRELPRVYTDDLCGGSVKDRLDRLQTQLHDNPIVLRGYPFGKPLYLGDREAMLVFHDTLYERGGHFAMLRALTAMEEHRPGYFASLSDWAMDWRDRIYWSYLDDRFSWPVHLSTACREMDHGPSAGPSLWPIYTPEEEDYQRDLCDAMGVFWAGRKIDAADFAGVPALVLSGNLDVITPPQYGRELANDIGAEYLLHPRESHGVLFWTYEDCVRQSVARFIDTLSFAIDSECQATL